MGRRTGRAALLVLGVVLGTTACTGGSGDDAAPSSSGGTASSSPSGSSSAAAGSPATSSGSTPSAGIPVDAPAIASGPAQQAGTVLEVLAAQRQGSTVLLTMAVRNSSSGAIHIGNSLGAPADYDVRNVALVDPVGLKRYLPYLDDSDHCVCSTTDFTDIPPGQRGIVTALYPALPAATRSVSVQTPIGAVADVPLS